MKILKKDLKHNIMKIVPETEDDLWVLEKVIEKGDLISGRTNRGIIIERGDKKEKVRKTVFLKLRANKTVFVGNELRVSGQIIEAPEDVTHSQHTFEIRINETVTIEKKWTRYQVDQIYNARKKQPKILICVLDDADADFAIMTQRLQYLTNIRGVTGKSLGEQSKTGYYNEIIKYLEQSIQNKGVEKIILAGPGFTKENIQKIVKEKKPKLAKLIYVDSVAHTGEPGIQEVLKRGIVDRVNKDSSIAQETELVEQFMVALSKDEKVVYGLKETKQAVEIGAVGILLISDKLVRDNQELLKKAEKKGANVKIINSEHDAGKRFFALGGIGGLLRYEMKCSL